MSIRIGVALAFPDMQEVVHLELAEGSTVGEALAACRDRGLLPPIPAECVIGIWARQVRADTVLRDNDRIELYRPLKADAKSMRRQRAGLKPASPRSRNGP